MTARQMATASFAVPKSVMNTMVGRAGATCAELAASLGAGCCEHAPKRNRTAKQTTDSRARFTGFSSTQNREVYMRVAAGFLVILTRYLQRPAFVRNILSI